MKNLCLKLAHALNDYMHGKGDYELSNQLVKEAMRVKYRAEIAAIGESVWSNNAMEYDSIDEVKTWLDGLASRWFGYDMSRIVTTDTPKNEKILPYQETYQNFRAK